MELYNNYTKVEWIDGTLLMSPRPRLNHMNTLSELTMQFNNYFKNSKCKARQEYALFLTKDDLDNILDNKALLRKLLNSKKAEVVPDLMVYCDDCREFYRGILGIPKIIVEVLSPSNIDDDLVIKYELYKSYGVLEYWVVSPMKRCIKIFQLNSGDYKEVSCKPYNEVSSSNIFKDLKIDLSEVHLVDEPDW